MRDSVVRQTAAALPVHDRRVAVVVGAQALQARQVLRMFGNDRTDHLVGRHAV